MFFYISPYRKIKYQLILDIITARIEELFEICYKKNTNIKSLKNKDIIYVCVDSPEYYKSIQYVLENSKLTTLERIFNNNLEFFLLAISKFWFSLFDSINFVHHKPSCFEISKD